MIGFGAGAWALWFWWHTFKQMAWSVQEYEREQQKDLSTEKTKYILIGISVALIGGLILVITTNLHYWWLNLLTGPICGGLICLGIALIVQTVKPKAKREG